MAKINVLALGGLDQKGRRLYVLEINSKIFIFDVGVFEPLTDDFGIKYYIPNMNYLNENKDKIKGVFLSSLDWNNIGALSQLVEIKKDIEIYGSSATIKSLKLHFGDVVNNWKTKKLEHNKIIEIAGIPIIPFEVASKIPGTFGYSLKTQDGNIIYAVDYIFDSIPEMKISTLEEISFLNNENNLLLISDVSLSRVKDAILSKTRITNILLKQIKKEQRIIVSLYDDEILNVIEIINIAKEYKRKIFFKNEKLFNIIKLLIENGNIEEFTIKLFKDSKEYDKKNSIVIFSSTKSKLYKNIELMIEENNANDFIFFEEDIFIPLAMPIIGNEHVFADVSNKVSRIDPTFVKLSNDDKLTFGTTEFDIRNLINYIKPKFFMPINANFREQDEARNIAINNGVNKKNIFVADNGEKYTINNGINEQLTQKNIDVDSKIIEGLNEKLISSLLIEERMTLGKDGFVIISFIFNNEKKIISSDIDIQMKGVIISKGQEELINNIKELILMKSYELVEINENLNKILPSLTKLIRKLFRETIKKIPSIKFNVFEI